MMEAVWLQATCCIEASTSGVDTRNLHASLKYIATVRHDASI